MHFYRLNQRWFFSFGELWLDGIHYSSQLSFEQNKRRMLKEKVKVFVKVCSRKWKDKLGDESLRNLENPSRSLSSISNKIGTPMISALKNQFDLFVLLWLFKSKENELVQNQNRAWSFWKHRRSNDFGPNRSMCLASHREEHFPFLQERTDRLDAPVKKQLDQLKMKIFPERKSIETKKTEKFCLPLFPSDITPTDGSSPKIWAF